MPRDQGAIDLLSFSFALSAMLVPSFWSFLSQWDSATGVPAHPIDFVATPNGVFASLRKYSASSCRIKRAFIHTARSLLVLLTFFSERRWHHSCAQRHSEPVRPMRDEDFFGGLRLVMPKVKREVTGLSLSDGRPRYAAVRRREPWMRLRVSHVRINSGYAE
jgi:hypothetical protein